MPESRVHLVSILHRGEYRLPPGLFDVTLGPAYPRDAAVMWGYAQAGVVLWSVLADDGTLLIEDELVFNGSSKNKKVASEVAQLALERLRERGWTVRRWLANPQMGEQRGAAGGETLLGTWQRAGVPLREADDDRINGWGRLRAWLRTNPRTGKPYLRFHPRCVYTIRTLGAAMQDDGHPEDIDADSELAACNALRFLVMGRPAPSREAVVRAVLPGSVGALLQQVRREAQPDGRLLGRANQSKRRGITARG